MTPLFKKLNFKNHEQVYVLHPPESFLSEMEAMRAYTVIKNKIGKQDKITFAIGFALTQAQVDECVHQIAPLLDGDAVFWMCYPKASSKKYRCEFNRDTGWNVMGQYNLEGVRQVAIDEDWSALRFRKVQYIKQLMRDEKMLLSKAGVNKKSANK